MGAEESTVRVRPNWSGWDTEGASEQQGQWECNKRQQHRCGFVVFAFSAHRVENAWTQ